MISKVSDFKDLPPMRCQKMTPDCPPLPQGVIGGAKTPGDR